MKKEIIILIDCGDTIVDESTQVFNENGDVLSAQEISGACEALRQLHGEGYRIALVADGRTASFHNILGKLDLLPLFEAMVISEEEQVQKPHKGMFAAAFERLGLTAKDAPRVVMVGNNIMRDVAGANLFGITSILLSFSPRYRMQPKSIEETPDYVIAMPDELPGLIAHLEKQLDNRKILAAE